MGATVEQVNDLLGRAVEALGRLVPFDLATIMELEGEELAVRVARGALAGPAVERHRLRLQDFPAIQKLLRDDHARAFRESDHRDGDGDAFDGVLDLPHGHSCMVVPLRVKSDALGIMTFDRRVCQEYAPAVVELADVFGKLLAVAMSYGEQSALLKRLGDQLVEQNRLLGERVEGRVEACSMLEACRSPAMLQVVHLARQVAAAGTPVLVTGETGTGKEVLANAIHGWSPRAGRPLVGINCAALPPNLIESELFGHVKGAFSGATAQRMGRFQAANSGTLFLDEIGELPVDLQAKILRALQEGCFEPVGSDRTVRVDVRLIAATNLDLLAAVASGRFRQDLYYRLAVFPIHVPPLRNRREDVAGIAASFLASLARRTGRGPWRLSERALRWLEEQEWRGNVRELVNALERATILSRGAELDLAASADLAAGAPPLCAPAPDAAEGPLPTLEEMERRHIRRALELTGGRLYGPAGSARLLGINPSTLRSRMQKLGLGRARDHRATGRTSS
ncbi:MAG: sigma 54-interacting transcriptional regulator [Planctomycetes bacterium]|nr:sigma 54-interacting transcriptional regulator [Planctomycetota bacterium]